MKSIQGFKFNKPINIGLPYWDTFKKPKEHTRLSPDRIFGIDTETFRSHVYNDTERTSLVQLDFYNPTHNCVLETRDVEYPLEAILDRVFPLYAEHEKNPSRTKQRPQTLHTTGVNKGDTYRNGRKQTIQPTVAVFFNLDYDLGRLVRNHPMFRRALLAGADSVRVTLGSYEIEIAHLSINNSASAFEFFIRRDHKIMRLFGRDLFGYLKCSLKEAAEQFLEDTRKLELPDKFFEHYWEDITPEEFDLLKVYARLDPNITRRVYEAVIDLLVQIDTRVICQNGLPPRSAPGAAAKMAFAMASVDEWKRPSKRVTQIGALAYAGARIFNRTPGYFEHIDVNDVTSMYPHAMTLLPDPATCKYLDIKPGEYIHETWRGQWGAMCVSGEGLDPYYPALRTHDTKHERLQYIYGTFEKIWTTIPEVVIGVESGRLRIDEIHEGIHIVGSCEDSFLRKFVLEVYKLKESSQKGSPMYIIAKLLMNSFYGKLLEVNIDKAYVESSSRAVQLPNVPAMKDEYTGLLETYVTGGQTVLEDRADELFEKYKDTWDGVDPLFFGQLVDKHTGLRGKAGSYYLPMHGAQITGFASAKLGLAAACTNALQGDTDSLFTLGPQKEGYQRYREIMLRAGYDAPEHGLGAFETEVEDAAGYLVKNKVYALEYRKEGKTVLKEAHHGIVGVENVKIFDLVKKFYENDYIEYTSKASPMPLREALHRGMEPGVFITEHRELHNVTDPNLMWDAQGERVWKPYGWEANNDLNHDTTPTIELSGILHDPQRYRANSGLNRIRPSRNRMKSPRLKVLAAKNESTLSSTMARSGSIKSYTKEVLLL